MANNEALKNLVLYTNDSYTKTFPNINVKQHDANSRYVEVQIRDEQNAVRLVGIPQLNATKPDGHKCYIGGEITGDNTVRVKLSSTLLEIPGRVSCDVTVFSTVDNAEETFIGDGSTKVFTSLSKITGVTKVVVSGRILAKTEFSYNDTTNKLTLNTVPAKGEVVLIYGSGIQMLTSSTFYLIVERSNYDPDADEAIDEFTTLDTSIAHIEVFVEEAHSYASSAASSAEAASTSAQNASTSATTAQNAASHVHENVMINEPATNYTKIQIITQEVPEYEVPTMDEFNAYSEEVVKLQEDTFKKSVGLATELVTDPADDFVLGGDSRATLETILHKTPTDVSNTTMFSTVDIAPASSTSEGLKGQVYLGTDYIFFCIANNTWRRISVSTF